MMFQTMQSKTLVLALWQTSSLQANRKQNIDKFVTLCKHYVQNIILIGGTRG